MTWRRARSLLHGSLGATDEMPFVEQVIQSFHMGLADGPTEVHKITLARQVLRDYKATDGLFPTQHIPKLREAAIKKYADRSNTRWRISRQVEPL